MKFVFVPISLFLITVFVKNLKEEKEFNFDWFQNDYMVIPGYAEVIRYDKNYVRYISARTFKLSRTCVAHNFTINYKISVGNDVEV
ncbi:hypothetical protein ILUMI_04533 [Ignelater luminosus]|uniref:Uncharacterized protein n=1 Tax=Ignelater luminosus TaxID=2038154 RepID=A0A8K0D8S8_IGNLU|nr:hypothetical protein ILUMI_04533 [Ignelater luminosus]